MIHLYYGNGKGKTTAACGLTLRASGSGMKVLFCQFFKNGASSEVRAMQCLENVDIMIPEMNFGRFKNMSEDQKEKISDEYHGFLRSVIKKAADYGLIVLDEAVSAYGYGLIGREDLTDFLKDEGGAREIVITGRDPAPELLELADYATEMRKEKHPYDKGVKARKGIEF